MKNPHSRDTHGVARGVMAITLLLGITLLAADRGQAGLDQQNHDHGDHARVERNAGDRGNGRDDDDRHDADRDRDDREYDTNDRDDRHDRGRDTLDRRTGKEDTLIVWASDQDHKAADFLAILDFDPDSRNYGSLIRRVPLVGASSHGNEPHHVGLSRDGRTLALGGLLSVLRGQDQVFFFDVTNPRRPNFIRSHNPPGASITDEFATLRNGGFLVTFMGGADGAAPGKVVEYDEAMDFVRAWPKETQDEGFNPHGISIDEAHNLMLTSDFICPLRTLHVHGGSVAQVRGSVRVWDFKERAITKVIPVGDPANPAGTMEVQLIPYDRQLRAYTAGMADGQLYLVDPKGGHARPVFDFNTLSRRGVAAMPQLLRVNRAGTRLFVTLNGAGKVAMFDIEQPRNPKLLSVVNLGPDSGPHYLRLTDDEKRLVVTNYFLVEDLAPGGIVNVEGDHKVHVLNVYKNRIERDRDFDVDFDEMFRTGPARPHGVVMMDARGR